MSIVHRLEKIRFLIQEMQLALYLAGHAPDDFNSRMIARHILIRAENFIVHARALKKPLNDLRIRTRAFHQSKENYAQFFDEYFQVSRDKLSAHLQDFDFGKRIELWNDIESTKISFFVESAKEIYEKTLGRMNIPGFIPYVDPPELTDSDLAHALADCQALTAKDAPAIKLGVDPLAMTRANTTTLRNGTLIHERAGQLTLIRRWVNTQAELMALLQPFDRMARILKARMITDIVSFCDCLFTRPVAPGAPQEMKGLNALVAETGSDDTTLDKFKSVYLFDQRLQPLRHVRDNIGAHLEGDAGIPLPALLNLLDSINHDESMEFFQRVNDAFGKVCRNITFLRLYAADDARLNGIAMQRSDRLVVPFDERHPRPPAPGIVLKQDYNDVQACQKQLVAWQTGDENAKEDARHFFWNAFLHAEVLEPLPEGGEPGGYWPYATHHLRKSHQFVIDLLSSSRDGASIAAALDLLLACRNSDPYMLAEIVVRCRDAIKRHVGEFAVCYCLGETASWPHYSVQSFLEAEARMGGPARFQATLALFKIFIRSEGVRRINQRQTLCTYTEMIAPFIADLPDAGKLYYLIAFASQFGGNGLGTYAQPFAEDYAAFQAEIKHLIAAILPSRQYAECRSTVDALLQTHDYTGLCLLFSHEQKVVGYDWLAKAFLEAATRGWVLTASHEQAQRHLAYCYLLTENFEEALAIAEALGLRHPDEPAWQVLIANVLAASPGRLAQSKRKIAQIRSNYRLTTETEQLLTALERQLSEKKQKRPPSAR